MSNVLAWLNRAYPPRYNPALSEVETVSTHAPLTTQWGGVTTRGMAVAVQEDRRNRQVDLMIRRKELEERCDGSHSQWMHLQLGELQMREEEEAAEREVRRRAWQREKESAQRRE